MLGHDVAAALPGLRAHGLSTLRDTADLQHRTGSSIHPDTGARVDVWTTYQPDVPCRVRTLLGEQAQESGGSQLTAQRMTASVPWSQAVAVGDRLMFTASDDPTLIGRALYVRAVPRGTDQVLRRLSVSDVQE